MTIVSLREKMLVLLAERGGVTGSVAITTSSLAEELDASQQTVSRVLIDLQRGGYIERRTSGRITRVVMTSKGLKTLRESYMTLKLLFEKPVKIVLEGKVFTGLGEGAYYIGIPGYLNQFREKLGFEPFLGTLNIRLASSESLRNREILEKLAPTEIAGFRDEKRTYGGARCMPAVFRDSDSCAILFIDRTHYDKTVVEVIAKENLRAKYGLKEGDLVSVHVTLGPSTPSQDLFYR